MVMVFVIVFLTLNQALSEMHSAGFIHGDVKNSNIMWDESSQEVKVIDFEVRFILLFSFNLSNNCATDCQGSCDG